jgi:chloride channel protein, CIC family
VPAPLLPGRTYGRSISGRLLVAAMLAGGLSALAAALVRLAFRGVQWVLTGSAQDLPLDAARLPPLRRALTPLAGAALAVVVLAAQRWRSRRAGQHDLPYVEYVEAVQREDGIIPLLPNLWRTLSAAFSVGSGAAVGREGSMIQFAATVASAAVRSLRGFLPDAAEHLPLLVACGVAGGVTAAYNAPVTGVCFAAEIALGRWRLSDGLALAPAALCASVVSGAVLGRERLYPVPVALPHLGLQIVLLVALAVLFALLGPVYLHLLSGPPVLRRIPGVLLLGGAAVGALSLLDARVWGNGDEALRLALGIAGPAAEGFARTVLLLLAMRCVATLLCVWTGTIGGVFTPTLFAGAAAAALLAVHLPGADRLLWALAGMSLLMSAVTHAPWMSAFIAVELTGNWHLLALLVPLDLLTWAVARRLSSRAMYAIASQAPHAAPARVSAPA